MKPPWLLLLEQRQKSGFGLTLPFLLGALRSPPGKPFTTEAEAQDALGALLESMGKDAPENYTVRIAHCDKTQQAVAALVYMPQEWCKKVGAAGSLYISPEYIKGKKQPEKALWRLCKKSVLSGSFSFIEGKQQNFNDQDLEFISGALATEAESDAQQ
jgi:hypothetical protein